MNELTMSVEFARELLYCDEYEGFKRIDDLYVNSGRWLEYRQLIVEDLDGQLWGSDYTVGLTELQYSSPWEDETEAVFYKVKKVPVEEYRYMKT